jgi:preprotein translocase subunit SecG
VAGSSALVQAAVPIGQAGLSESVPWLSTILNWLVLVAGLVLVFLVLIQRGKGGGLAGAFGGAGGSSAFGSRAGDLFTKITIGVALVWVVLIMIHVKVVQYTRPETAPPVGSVVPEGGAPMRPEQPPPPTETP